jgi:hypothetical protein
MADEEKALERFSGFLDDRLSLKSGDSKGIEASLGLDGINLSAHTDPKGVDAGLSDIENGSNSTTPDHSDNRPASDPNLVDWDGDQDTENPLNFSVARKIWMSTMASVLTFSVSFASSVFSSDTRVTAEEFNVSEEVMVSKLTGQRVKGSLPLLLIV